MLALLEGDMIRLTHGRAIFVGYQAMVRANPAIQSPGNFHQWLANSYGEIQAVRIRRLVKGPAKPNVALERFLSEVGANVDVLTLERYRATRRATEWEMDERRFLELAAEDGSYLSPSTPATDWEELKAGTADIREWVDRYVVHHDERGTAADPTFDELAEATDLVLRVFNRYNWLLNDVTLGATIPAPWQRIFEQAWIMPPPPRQPRPR